MGSDFWLVVRFWGALFVIGAAAFPLTKRLFGSLEGQMDQTKVQRKKHDELSTTDEVKKTSGWWDEGYLFSKAVGLVTVTYFVWLMASFHLVPFTYISIIFALVIVFIVGLVVLRSKKENLRASHQNYWQLIGRIALEELFFFAAFLFWSWIKGHEANIHSLEKFMDYGFTKSILNSAYFPPPDIWYAGGTINYYYFGHTVMALLTRLSGLDLAYSFNLMLTSLFAFTLTMSFSIGVQLSRWRWRHLYFINGPLNLNDQQDNKSVFWQTKTIVVDLVSGLLTAFLVTLAGNMQTIYAFTKGYQGDKVLPFWQLLWNPAEFFLRLSEGLNTYWYANATRFIPFTIHEFPSYSFVVSDVHGHVLSLPFVLLAVALLLIIFGTTDSVRKSNESKSVNRLGWWRGRLSPVWLLFYGILIAVLFMTNALDGPIYFGLFSILLVIYESDHKWFSLLWWKEKLMQEALVLIAGPAVMPFVLHFKTFVSGLAINCPWAGLTNQKIGFFLFEGVEKCQHSPFWMVWLLWGFFIFCGAWFIRMSVNAVYESKTADLKVQPSKLEAQMGLSEKLHSLMLSTRFTPYEIVLLVFFIFSVGLIIFPEFFYFKDIYPAHFRSNTMFKLGYQAFIMFAILSAYTISSMLVDRWKETKERLKSLNSPEVHAPDSNYRNLIKKLIFFVLLVPQLFLVSIYPIFSVRSYFDSLRQYSGLYGLSWLERQYPDDASGIYWLNQHKSELITTSQKSSDSSLKNCASAKTLDILDVSCRLDVPTIVEADGDSYTDYARFAAFTGLPSVIGWPVHEWLWRGTYDVVGPRREDVRRIYEEPDVELTRKILAKYRVSYVIVGTLERQKYPTLQETKFSQLGDMVFHQGETSIYRVNIR